MLLPPPLPPLLLHWRLLRLHLQQRRRRLCRRL
jgi:hypothetical protein